MSRGGFVTQKQMHMQVEQALIYTRQSPNHKPGQARAICRWMDYHRLVWENRKQGTKNKRKRQKSWSLNELRINENLKQGFLQKLQHWYYTWGFKCTNQIESKHRIWDIKREQPITRQGGDKTCDKVNNQRTREISRTNAKVNSCCLLGAFILIHMNFICIAPLTINNVSKAAWQKYKNLE